MILIQKVIIDLLKNTEEYLCTQGNRSEDEAANRQRLFFYWANIQTIDYPKK